MGPAKEEIGREKGENPQPTPHHDPKKKFSSGHPGTGQEKSPSTPPNPNRGLKYRKPKDLRRGKQEPPPKERQGILYPPLNPQKLKGVKEENFKMKEGGRRN